jgi:cell division protein FtsA
MAENYSTALDIGSSKIVILAAEKLTDQQWKVFAWASVASRGVKNGMIIDTKKTSEDIQSATKALKDNYKTTVKAFRCNISDVNITNINQSKELPIIGKTVNKKDIKKTAQSASTLIRNTEYILVENTKYFTLDEQVSKIYHPEKMPATFLKAHAYLSTVSPKIISTLKECFATAKCNDESFTFSAIAAAQVCVSDSKDDNEKMNGVCVMDIGADTTDLTVFNHGMTVYNKTYEFAGGAVDSAISKAFKTSLKEAKRLKETYGKLQLNPLLDDELIVFEQTGVMGSRFLSAQTLNAIIESEFLNLFKQIQRDLQRENLMKSIDSGFVLCGGSACIEGLDKLLLKTYNKRTRIAKIDTKKIMADNDLLNNPAYTCALGLFRHASKDDAPLLNTGFLGKMKKFASLK